MPYRTDRRALEFAGHADAVAVVPVGSDAGTMGPQQARPTAAPARWRDDTMAPRSAVRSADRSRVTTACRVRAGPTGKGVVRSAGAGPGGIGAPGAAAHSNDLRRKGRPDHGERRKAWARWWGASRAALRRARGCGRPRVQGLRGAGGSRVGVRAATSAAVRGYGARRCRRSRKELAWCQAQAPALPWGCGRAFRPGSR